jgi:MoxR-like ATPase
MVGQPSGGPTLNRPSSPAGGTPDLGATDGAHRIDADRAEQLFGALVANVSSVVYTHPANLRLAVGTFVSGGHLLVEDLPGLGKTTLAKALARSFGLTFRRVQCTADLLPSDITGAMVFDRKQDAPVFRPGPIFTHVLMADELNRASPRTQSALLESMEERQVTVDGHSEPLPSPFMVVATQNPHDAVGTSPLPHGQRDRFLVRLSMGYPGRPSEEALLAGRDPAQVVTTLDPALSAPDLAALMEAVEAVRAGSPVLAYILDLVDATRAHPSVTVGASPRAARALLQMGKAMAMAEGRSFVVPEDIRTAAVVVVAHRLVLDPRSQLTGAGADDVVEEILDTTSVPLGSSADR